MSLLTKSAESQIWEGSQYSSNMLYITPLQWKGLGVSKDHLSLASAVVSSPPSLDPRGEAAGCAGDHDSGFLRHSTARPSLPQLLPRPEMLF